MQFVCVGCLIVVYFTYFVLYCDLSTRFTFFKMSFMIACFVCFSFYFVCSVLCIVLCIVSPHVHSCSFTICLQVYGPLQPGGNPTAVKKYIYFRL
jgi:hypothetical protein